VPLAGDAQPGAAEREHQLLARRVQPAGGAVEAVEDDALDRRVDPAGWAAARLARVGDLWRRLAELDADQRGAAQEQGDEHPGRGLHAILRRKPAATISASAANPAQRKKAGRDARVIVAAIAPKRRSRTAASAGSVRAPWALNGCFRSGVSPSCALANALRRSSATGTFLSRPIRASSSTAVPRSSALSPASGAREASSGAISASASTRPASWSSATFESTGSASPRPAPQSASDQIMKPTLAEGSSASPTSPTASSAAPPRTAVSGSSLSHR